MRVLVTVVEGKQHNARKDGQLVTYKHGDQFVVSQHVLEKLGDRLVKIRELRGDEVAPKAERATPGLVVSTPGAGAERTPAAPVSTPDDDDGDGEGTDETEHADDGADPLVAALAEVGHVVDPAAVEAWTDEQRERAAKLVERGGGNPPKFVLEAKVQG